MKPEPANATASSRTFDASGGAFAQILEPLRSRPRARAMILALLCTYAYFIGPPAWNQNSRFALTQALVEERSPAIDRFAATTGDKSFLDGHFYSDKAPGVSFLAVPAYAAFTVVRTLAGARSPEISVVTLDPVDLAADRAPSPDRLAPGDRVRYSPAYRVAMYLSRLGSTILLAGAGLIAFFLVALRLARDGAGDRGRRDATALALTATAIYGLATPAFLYATALYGHRPAADALMIAFALVWLHPEPGRAREAFGVAVGTALGWAVLFEYTAAIPVAVLTVWSARRLGRGAMLTLVATGGVWAGVLAAYHTWAFGGPLQTGYDHVYLPQFAEGMRVRYGFGPPNPRVAIELLYGSYRGLFFVSPVLLLAVWGLAVSPSRVVRTLGLGFFLYYLLLVSGYYMWDGGAATGPRHVLPAIPFLALGLVEAARRIPGTTAIFSAVSAVMMLASADSGVEAPQNGVAIWGHALSQLHRVGSPGVASASNLGRFAGLPGPLSLLPLFALWMALSALTPPPRRPAPPKLA